MVLLVDVAVEPPDVEQAVGPVMVSVYQGLGVSMRRSPSKRWSATVDVPSTRKNSASCHAIVLRLGRGTSYVLIPTRTAAWWNAIICGSSNRKWLARTVLVHAHCSAAEMCCF